MKMMISIMLSMSLFNLTFSTLAAPGDSEELTPEELAPEGLTPKEKKALKKEMQRAKEHHDALKESIPYAQKKFIEPAQKELAELERSLKKYENYFQSGKKKSPKILKQRKAEYEAVKKRIKANKILIVYMVHHKVYVSNTLRRAKHPKIMENLQNIMKLGLGYKELTGETLPDFYAAYQIKLFMDKKKKK